MIITFSCIAGKVFIFRADSIMRPMRPYTTHKTIDDAKEYLGGGDIEIVNR